MDYGYIFRRAAQITVRHRSLWLLGMLIALTEGGSGGNSSSSNGELSELISSEISRPITGVFESLARDTGVLLATLGGVFCVAVLISIALVLVSEIGRGGLIASVNRIEQGESAGFSYGWSAGVGRAKSLAGQYLLLQLPLIIFVILMLISVIVIAATTAAGAGFGPDALVGAVTGGLLCFVFPLICGVLIYSIGANLLGIMGARAIMLEGAGAVDGIKLGWARFRQELGAFLLIGIADIIISLTIGFILAGLALALVFGALVGAGVNLNSLGSNDFTLSPTFVLGFSCLGILILIAALFISGIVNTFLSSLWTLTYRAALTPKRDLPPAAQSEAVSL
jgi:hypothetical protein